jgi:hypothetical protein
VPISAVDSVSPALRHTKEQLFRPFQFGQWSRLALVGLFAGEFSSGSGCSSPNFFHTQTIHRNFAFAAAPPDWALLAPLIVIAVVAVPVLWLALMYVNSRMRFVLFDSVIAKRCELGRMWRARRQPAFHYFIWQIVFSLVMLAAISVVIGVPALGAFLFGWFTAPNQHIAGLILGGIFVFFVFIFCLLFSIIVHVFTKDFVVPQMALEDISAFEGWRRLWAMLQTDKASYAGYGGMKLILAIGAAFGVGILSLIVIILLLIPFGGVGAITVLAGKAAGLGWNVFTITAAVVAGSIFVLIVLYVISMVSVPVIVFFPAFSIYFFAARYWRLGALISPPPPPPPLVPPIPEPIG